MADADEKLDSKEKKKSEKQAAEDEKIRRKEEAKAEKERARQAKQDEKEKARQARLDEKEKIKRAKQEEKEKARKAAIDADPKKKAKEEKKQAKRTEKEAKRQAKQDKKDAAGRAKEEKKAARKEAKAGVKDHDEELPAGRKQKEERENKPPKPDKAPMLLVIYTAVLAFGLLSVGAFFFTKAWLLPKVHQMKVERRLNNIREDRALQNKMGIVTKLQSIMTNTYGSTRRYVKAEISVEAGSQEIIDDVIEREPRYRDALISYFRNHSAAELSNPEFWPKAKEEIKRIINRNLSQGWVDSIYFNELIVD